MVSIVSLVQWISFLRWSIFYLLSLSTTFYVFFQVNQVSNAISLYLSIDGQSWRSYNLEAFQTFHSFIPQIISIKDNTGIVGVFLLFIHVLFAVFLLCVTTFFCYGVPWKKGVFWGCFSWIQNTNLGNHPFLVMVWGKLYSFGEIYHGWKFSLMLNLSLWDFLHES